MAIEKVREYFKKYDMEDRIREFAVSSANVELAAEALHCEPCRIAKSLSFQVNGNPILVVAAGDVKVDNAKYKAKFGTKAKMLTVEEVEAMIGHAVGGVCPFGLPEGIGVYLDESLKRHAMVFPAAGTPSSAVGFEPDALAAATDGQWVYVTKDPE